MKLNLLPALPGVVSLTSVGFHYTSNMAFVYGLLGFDIHLMTIAVAMLSIHVFLFLRELGRVSIEGTLVNISLGIIDLVLQGLVLVPFFVTSEGGFINLSEVDGKFWWHVIAVAAGIALLRFAVYLFVHGKYTNSNNKDEHLSKNEYQSKKQKGNADEPVEKEANNWPAEQS